MSALGMKSTPPWSDTAISAYMDAREAGARPTRFRLTAEQVDELRAYTGQDRTLLGLPVVEGTP